MSNNLPLKKIKVLHIIKNFNLGGAETNLLNLITAIDPNKFEIHIAYSSQGEIKDKFEKQNLTLFQYSPGDHKIKSLATLGIVLRLSNYMRKHQIDIVHTHNFNAHVWGALAAKLSGRKILEHVHDYRYLDFEEFRRRRGQVFQFQYIKYFKNWSDRVVVLTRQNAEYLKAHHFYPESKIREIRNGIPMDRVKTDAGQTRRRLGIPSQALMVLTPARLSDEKNIDLVIDTAKRVMDTGLEVYFVIAGDGPLKNDLERRVERYQLSSHVRLIGFYSDINELLDTADVFFLPSFLELHSIAVLEAMSRAVPVVTSLGTGCNDEVFEDGVTAFLRDPFKNEGWCEALLKLLSDSEFREKMGRNGFSLCEKEFDVRITAKKFERLYEELV